MSNRASAIFLNEPQPSKHKGIRAGANVTRMKFGTQERKSKSAATRVTEKEEDADADDEFAVDDLPEPPKERQWMKGALYGKDRLLLRLYDDLDALKEDENVKYIYQRKPGPVDVPEEELNDDESTSESEKEKDTYVLNKWQKALKIKTQDVVSRTLEKWGEYAPQGGFPSPKGPMSPVGRPRRDSNSSVASSLSRTGGLTRIASSRGLGKAKKIKFEQWLQQKQETLVGESQERRDSLNYVRLNRQNSSLLQFRDKTQVCVSPLLRQNSQVLSPDHLPPINTGSSQAAARVSEFKRRQRARTPSPTRFAKGGDEFDVDFASASTPPPRSSKQARPRREGSIFDRLYSQRKDFKMKYDYTYDKLYTNVEYCGSMDTVLAAV